MNSPSLDRMVYWTLPDTSLTLVLSTKPLQLLYGWKRYVKLTAVSPLTRGPWENFHFIFVFNFDYRYKKDETFMLVPSIVEHWKYLYSSDVQEKVTSTCLLKIKIGPSEVHAIPNSSSKVHTFNWIIPIAPLLSGTLSTHGNFPFSPSSSSFHPSKYCGGFVDKIEARLEPGNV